MDILRMNALPLPCAAHPGRRYNRNQKHGLETY